MVDSRSRRLGYTLFELMVVMALILILSAVAAPLALQRKHEDMKVIAAADVVKARWADCRAQAVEDNRPYMFSIVPNSGKFRVEPFGSASLVGTGMTAGGGIDSTAVQQNGSGDPTGGGMIFEDTLPSGVRFGTKDHPVDPDGSDSGSGDYVPVAVFLPNGGAADDVEINFAVKGARVVTLRLRALTATSSSDIGEFLK